MPHVTANEVRDALNDVDFPAGKDELVDAAQRGGASEDVCKALRSVPPVDYDSADEVVRSVTRPIGSEPTAGQRSDPEHGTDDERVADWLR
jgi:hypothetical protein